MTVTPVQRLLDAVGKYLRANEPWPDVAEACAQGVLRAIDAASAPPRLRADDWIATHDSLAPLLTAVHGALALLCWRQNKNYRDPALLERYAYCELLGPAGHAAHDRFAVGLLWLAPHTFYPPHAHPAEEAYHLLFGTSDWQQGEGAPQRHAAGARIVHPSRVPHSMRSADEGLLALYVWRGEIDIPARMQEPAEPARTAHE